MSNRFKWDLGCCIWNMLSKTNLLQPDIVVLACISKSNPHGTKWCGGTKKKWERSITIKMLKQAIK